MTLGRLGWHWKAFYILLLFYLSYLLGYWVIIYYYYFLSDADGLRIND
jgi:hypothetical protein